MFERYSLSNLKIKCSLVLHLHSRLFQYSSDNEVAKTCISIKLGVFLIFGLLFEFWNFASLELKLMLFTLNLAFNEFFV